VIVCKVWAADYPWDVRVESASRTAMSHHATAGWQMPIPNNLFVRRGEEALARRCNWETDERRLLAAVRTVTEPFEARAENRLRATLAPSQGRRR